MDTAAAISALGALAQEDRLAAFRYLMAEGRRGAASGDVAQKLDIQPTRMSFHLVTLERAGLIERRREGRNIRYSVRHDAMRALLAFLVKDCCRNDPDICSLELPLVPSGPDCNRT